MENKHYVVIYCHRNGRRPEWNQLEFDAPGIYEASVKFFESPVIKELYPTLLQVQFQRGVKGE